MSRNSEDPFESEYVDPPRPESGDTLFASAGDWQNNACLWKRSIDEWYPYIRGYKRAADVLEDHIVNQHRYDVDTLVYPIVFLYRHYLELQLKAIIIGGFVFAGYTLSIDGDLLNDRVGELYVTHKVDVLWKRCRSILVEVWPDGPEDELNAVDKCIEEICEFDLNSMAFRYPVDKEGNSSLPDSLQFINVRHLTETMEKIARLLNGAHIGIQEYLDFKLNSNLDYL